MRRLWDYSTYRGRRTARENLILIVIILAVALVLAIGAFFYLQQYIVYTEDGARLDLPFFSDLEQGAQSEPTPPPEQPVQVVVEEPEPPPVPEVAMQLALLPVSSVEDGTVAALAEAAGADGVILDMKDDQGQLHWYLSDPPAQAGGHPDEALNLRLAALTGGELYTVARFSCFKDHALAQDTAYAILTNSGYRWTDPESVRWSSPTDPDVHAYLIARLVELAELGFDEILLDNCGYPNRGNLGYIRRGAAYDRDALSGHVTAFLQKASAALAPYETVLSVRCDVTALTGEDTLTGLTAAALESYAARLWLPAQEQIHLPALLVSAGVTDADNRLVVLTAQPEADAQTPQAQLELPSF